MQKIRMIGVSQSTFSETPLHIYQVGYTTNINDRTKTFSLRFTTAEMMRNNRIRVAQAYEGEPSVEIVKKIVRDPELLDSKKEFYYEETTICSNSLHQTNVHSTSSMHLQNGVCQKSTTLPHHSYFMRLSRVTTSEPSTV